MTFLEMGMQWVCTNLHTASDEVFTLTISHENISSVLCIHVQCEHCSMLPLYCHAQLKAIMYCMYKIRNLCTVF